MGAAIDSPTLTYPGAVLTKGSPLEQEPSE
jgi:hypothetical protein